MNERIQKLIEQATSTQGPTPYNPLTFEVFDKEKFAELIVEECFKAAMIESKGHMNPTDLVKRMKERVGVEE